MIGNASKLAIKIANLETFVVMNDYKNNILHYVFTINEGYITFIDTFAIFIKYILCLKCVELIVNLAFRDLVMFGDRPMYAFLTKI